MDAERALKAMRPSDDHLYLLSILDHLKYQIGTTVLKTIDTFVVLPHNNVKIKLTMCAVFALAVHVLK